MLAGKFKHHLKNIYPIVMLNFKEPFLEFLRNLTPQILLLSIAVVMSAKLDLERPDITNLWGSLPFFLVLAVFFAAMLANVLIFMEKSVKSIEVVNLRSQELFARNIRGVKYFFELFFALWNVKKLFLIELIFIVFVIQAGVAAVFVGAIPAASALYEATHSSNKQISCKKP